MKKDLKWGFIQPLIGGAYLGAESAIGKPAEWILSFPGFCAHTDNEDGTVKSCGNDYHLMKYLEKHDRLPNYMTIDRAPFADLTDDDNDINPTIIRNEFSKSDSVSFENIDIVCALPVCSGLSNATTTKNEETKAARNNNMKWITKFVLKRIQPKAYIFENAPALFAGKKAEPIRKIIEDLALENGYAVSYFKTDTNLHHNAQNRPRTFVICWKWQNGEMQTPPVINFENAPMSVKEFLAGYPTDSIQDFPEDITPLNQCLMDFMVAKYPEDWREKVAEAATGMGFVIQNNLDNEFIEYVKNYKFSEEKHRDQSLHCVTHAREKYESDSWIFDTTLKVVTEKKGIMTVMHKNNTCMLHPFENRLFKVSELAYCMGMPKDFYIYGGKYEHYWQVGQNVPAKTMQYIVSEIVRIVSDWDNLRGVSNGNDFFGGAENVEYVDNTRQQYSFNPGK